MGDFLYIRSRNHKNERRYETDDDATGSDVVRQLLIIPNASHCDLYDGGYTELVGKGLSSVPLMVT